jgi:hypothetical protein
VSASLDELILRLRLDRLRLVQDWVGGVEGTDAPISDGSLDVLFCADVTSEVVDKSFHGPPHLSGLSVGPLPAMYRGSMRRGFNNEGRAPLQPDPRFVLP